MRALLFLHGIALRRALEAFSVSRMMRTIAAFAVALIVRHVIIAVVAPIRFEASIPLGIILIVIAVGSAAIGISLLVTKAFDSRPGIRAGDEALLRLNGFAGREWLFAAQLSQIRNALAATVMFMCFGGLIGKALPWSVELLALCAWILTAALIPLLRVAMRNITENTTLLRLFAITLCVDATVTFAVLAACRIVGKIEVDAIWVASITLLVEGIVVICAHWVAVTAEVFSERDGTLTRLSNALPRSVGNQTLVPLPALSGAAAPLFVMLRSLQLSPAKIVQRIAIVLAAAVAFVLPAALLNIDVEDQSRYIACTLLSLASIAAYSARPVAKHIGHPIWRIACGVKPAHILMTIVAAVCELHLIGAIAVIGLSCVFRDLMPLAYLPLMFVAVFIGRLLAVTLDWRLPHPMEFTDLIRLIQLCVAVILLLCAFAPCLNAGIHPLTSYVATLLLLVVIGTASSAAALRAPWRSASADNRFES